MKKIDKLFNSMLMVADTGRYARVAVLLSNHVDLKDLVDWKGISEKLVEIGGTVSKTKRCVTLGDTVFFFVYASKTATTLLRGHRFDACVTMIRIHNDEIGTTLRMGVFKAECPIIVEIL